MKSFALLNEFGFVEQIVNSPHDDYKEGEIYNNLTARELPIGHDPAKVLNDWYWDNGWNIRDAHPTRFHFWNVETKIWELNEEQLLAHHKFERNQRLVASDWTQLPDSPLTESQKQEWAIYRNLLRNMTKDDYLEGNFPNIPDTIK